MTAAGAQARVVPITLATAAPDTDWRVEGDDIELTLALSTPLQPESDGQRPAPAIGSLARAVGQIIIDGQTQPIDSGGLRTTFEGLLDADWQTLNQVGVWFADDYGMVLTSLAPKSAQTHADSIISAAVLGSEGVVAEDPRLSTTYQPAGHPHRAGVELWLPLGEEGEELFPVRASGEEIADAMCFEHDGIGVRAVPFRWFGRERLGPGIYLQARR